MRKTLQDPLRPMRRGKRRGVALGPADPDRIDVGNPAEVRWWCRELDVSSRDLLAMVETVGRDIEVVRKALAFRRIGPR